MVVKEWPNGAGWSETHAASTATDCYTPVNCYSLTEDVNGLPQAAGDWSFIGGRPRIPADKPLPKCRFCRSIQTFFFQVAFPLGHPWDTFSVATFSCTTCDRDGALIPKMLPYDLKGAIVPLAFLKSRPANYKFMVFDTKAGTMRLDYTPRVAFRRWNLVACFTTTSGNKIGGQPNWTMPDESPASCEGNPMAFLLQISYDQKYAILPGAPQQACWSASRNEQRDYYELFVGNALYLFGTIPPRYVYSIVQKD